MIKITNDHLRLIVDKSIESERVRARTCKVEISLDRIKGFIEGYVSALTDVMSAEKN